MKGLVPTILLFLLTIVAAWGQSRDMSTYRIQQDDILRIQIYGDQQFQSVEVPVTRDGNISAPFVGVIRAEGKTTSELEAELTAEYRKVLHLRDPKVSVTFARIRPIRASVSGAVLKPGQFDLRPGDTLLTLLSQAGDVDPNRANPRRAILKRADTQEVIPVDLFAITRYGDMSQNYEIHDGDILTVPEDAQNKVSILGYVQRPGNYLYREPMTLADAISQAGGEIPNRARMSKIRILRPKPGSPGDYLMIQADFVRFVNGDVSQNIELARGDTIFVPQTNTPNLNELANSISSLFYIQQILRGGIFGFKLLR